VISPLDNNKYCRKNGQFSRHLTQHGFNGYQDFVDKTYPNDIKICSCGGKCSFDSSSMSYLRSCGNRDCVGKITSSVKSNFSEKQWADQKQKYKTTMSGKSEEDINETNARRQSTWISNHGVDHPWKSSAIQEKRQTTIMAKYGYVNYSSSIVPADSLLKLQDVEWLTDQHVNKQIPLYVIAEQLGVSDGMVGKYLHKFNIPVHSFQHSQQERELHEFLDDNNIAHECNNRSVISPKELDFFLPDFNIAIELCGLYWHSERQERIYKHYHQNKYNSCQSLGIELLTIFEDEWVHNKPQILDMLRHKLNISNTDKVYARKTSIDLSVPTKERASFLNDNHLQGNGNGSICIGARNGDDLVAVLLISTRKDGVFYIDRYATSCNVPGGFSKLLHAFKQQHEWTQIITFSDNRYGSGQMYHTNGFTLDSELAIDYQYVVRGKRKHKFNFRHKQLSKMLADYSPELSERDNCFNHGIYRIWDCGKKRFTMTNSQE